MASCTDVIAIIHDGAVYCHTCVRPGTVAHDPEYAAIFGDNEQADGSACAACGACLVDGEWLAESDATDPRYVRWSVCDTCGHHRPYQVRHTREYRAARLAARRGTLGCPCCLRDTVHF